MILKIVFAGIVASAFCILFQVKGWNVLIAGLNGSFGYFIYLLLLERSDLMAMLCASAAMALYGEAAARIRKAPTILFLSPALIPIVPGGGMFECALQVMEGERYEAVVQLGHVLMQAGAIAIGIILTSSFLRFMPKRKSV